MTNYETNSLAFDTAMNAAPDWSTRVYADVAQDEIRAHLFGSLMALVGPAEFAVALANAERFAGKPVTA